MFHGAWGVQVGGSEAMKDYSEVLGKINAATKSTLLTRYELKPEQIDEWFAEGREGWLTADEMKAAGIAQEIIGVDDAAMNLDGVDTGEFDAHGLKIAALVTGLAGLKAMVQNNDGQNIATQDGGGAAPDGTNGKSGHEEEQSSSSEQSVKPSGAASETKPGATLQPGDSGQTASVPSGKPTPSAIETGPSAERIAGRAEGRDEAVSEYAERFADLNKRLTAAQANERKMQGERDKALADLALDRENHSRSLREMSDQLKLATDRVAQFLNGGLSFSPAPQTWEDALKACGGEYVKAARAYPELKQAYNAQNTRK